MRKITDRLITAIVTSTYSKDGMVLCDATGYRVNSTYNEIIVPSRFRYEAHAPQQGDKILIQMTDQGEHVLHSVLTVHTDLLNEVQEDEYVLKFDEKTKLHFHWTYYNSSDNEVTADEWYAIEDDPDKYRKCNINLEASEDVSITVQGETSLLSKGNISVTCEDEASVTAENNIKVKSNNGDIKVSAPSGDVFIDEGGSTTKVATENHTHDYSGTTSDGASYSGTTTEPDDVTEVELE